MNSKILKSSLALLAITLAVLISGCGESDVTATVEPTVVVEPTPVVTPAQDSLAQVLEAPPVAPAIN